MFLLHNAPHPSFESVCSMCLQLQCMRAQERLTKMNLAFACFGEKSSLLGNLMRSVFKLTREFIRIPSRIVRHTLRLRWRYVQSALTTAKYRDSSSSWLSVLRKNPWSRLVSVLCSALSCAPPLTHSFTRESYEFRQASNFWYLTRFEEPDSALILGKSIPYACACVLYDWLIPLHREEQFTAWRLCLSRLALAFADLLSVCFGLPCSLSPPFRSYLPYLHQGWPTLATALLTGSLLLIRLNCLYTCLCWAEQILEFPWITL